MDFLDLTLPTTAEDVALDEALLLEAEAGTAGEVLRLWSPAAYAVVLGSACKIAEDVDEGACQVDGVPVVRRSSGGGTVLLGPGCLAFSLVLRYDRGPAVAEIGPSYRYVLGRTLEALALPGATLAGTSDLAVDGRKFSGNAQQRKRDHVLHHGTILYAFDRSAVGRYLRLPQRQPDYRAGRDHEAFLGNVPLGADELRRRLAEAWGAERVRTDWPAEVVARLVAEKYGLAEWTRRR